jgi:hypothetical protein
MPLGTKIAHVPYDLHRRVRVTMQTESSPDPAVCGAQPAIDSAGRCIPCPSFAARSWPFQANNALRSKDSSTSAFFALALRLSGSWLACWTPCVDFNAETCSGVGSSKSPVQKCVEWLAARESTVGHPAHALPAMLSTS